LPLTFAQLVERQGVETFLRETWGKGFAHLPGRRGAFRDLLSWHDVNGMLQKHRLEPPRLRLVRRGEFAAKKDFLRYEGGTVPFVVPELLSRRLREGYTLIIDAVDDMVDGVMSLAEDFERVLRESVQVNLYAAWREEQGFHRHFDTHDVIVLQVYGRKQWRVYRGGRPHPLKNDSAPAGDPPDSLAWEGLLEDGDALYIPRGWWHEASGVGDVTLHLTFGIHPRTGITLMQWLTDGLRESEVFRADLLRFGSEEEKQRQREQLRETLMARFDEGLFERYFADHDARSRTRGWASLPWSVALNASLPSGALVSLDTPRPLAIRRDGPTIRLLANKREWTFDAAAEPLLRMLEKAPATLEELCEADTGLEDERLVRRFVTELAMHGLLRIDGRES
jgi:hypothetical protein